MRTIICFSSIGGKKVIETDATTWGEIKEQVGQHYDLSNLLPTEATNKTTLTNDSDRLPEGDFKLFLRPERTKSGAFDPEVKKKEDFSKEVLSFNGKLFSLLGEFFHNSARIATAEGIEESNRAMARTESETEIEKLAREMAELETTIALEAAEAEAEDEDYEAEQDAEREAQSQAEREAERDREREKEEAESVSSFNETPEEAELRQLKAEYDAHGSN